MKEYALSPIFGSRVEACLLGSSLPVASFRQFARPHLREAIATTLGIRPDEVDIGVTRRGAELWRYYPSHILEPAGSIRSTAPPKADISSTRAMVTVFFTNDAWDDMKCIELGFQLVDKIISGEADAVAKLGISFADVPPVDVVQPMDSFLGERVEMNDHEEALQRWSKRTGTRQTEDDDAHHENARPPPASSSSASLTGAEASSS